MNVRLLLALTLLAATAPLQAAVYQCTDANGKTAYQGQPQGKSMNAQFLFAARIPATITCSR